MRLLIKNCGEASNYSDDQADVAISLFMESHNISSSHNIDYRSHNYDYRQTSTQMPYTRVLDLELSDQGRGGGRHLCMLPCGAL